MMQATEDRFHKDERIGRQTMAVFSLRHERMLLRRIRHTRSQCAVRTSAVVMGHPAFENRTQMRFGNRDQPIEAFAPGCPNHAVMSKFSNDCIIPPRGSSNSMFHQTRMAMELVVICLNGRGNNQSVIQTLVIAGSGASRSLKARSTHQVDVRIDHGASALFQIVRKEVPTQGRPGPNENWCLWILCASSIPAIVTAALANDLKPRMGPHLCLIAR
jgi:hypothetical protein